MTSAILSEIVSQLTTVRRDVKRLERRPQGVTYSDNNVSSPPTDAELDTAFGTPAVRGPFVGILDDAGASSTVYLVASDGTAWWYVSMTKAV